MRKIEKQMCAAVHNNVNWSSGNTAVLISLHSNNQTFSLAANTLLITPSVLQVLLLLY